LIVLLPGRNLLEGFDVEGNYAQGLLYWEGGLCFCLLLAETVGIPYCTGKLNPNATGKEGWLRA
jgi:hypothetical protein